MGNPTPGRELRRPASAPGVSRRRPFRVDGREYPFESRWLERAGSAMHYVDEGEGRPVLMLHGNPTWSFLYRRVIRDLRDECRCIAPDYPGFGLSDHPPDYGYTPGEHARWVGELVDELGLDGIVVVGQDWGGPIALRTAVDRPDRTAGAVLANTWCWSPDWPVRLFSRAMGGSTLGRWLQLEHNFFARRLVPMGIHRPERRTEPVLEAYRRPFPDRESRVGTWVFPRSIRTFAGWLEATWRELDGIVPLPVELVWGAKDPAFGREAYVERWRGRFPDARVDRVADAGHYLQEDRPERMAQAVTRCLHRI